MRKWNQIQNHSITLNSLIQRLMLIYLSTKGNHEKCWWVFIMLLLRKIHRVVVKSSWIFRMIYSDLNWKQQQNGEKKHLTCIKASTMKNIQRFPIQTEGMLRTLLNIWYSAVKGNICPFFMETMFSKRSQHLQLTGFFNLLLWNSFGRKKYNPVLISSKNFRICEFRRLVTVPWFFWG